jgi:hypothetical protein
VASEVNSLTCGGSGPIAVSSAITCCESLRKLGDVLMIRLRWLSIHLEMCYVGPPTQLTIGRHLSGVLCSLGPPYSWWILLGTLKDLVR